MKIRTTHEAAEHRYTLFVDANSAAMSEYFDTGTVRTFFHTVTIPQFRGRGLAAELTEFALNDTRRRGLSVNPSCWFVREFIETNAVEYGDLLTSAAPRDVQ